MEDVDNAAVDYLHELLSVENQEKITAALRKYQAGEGSRMEEFKAALQARIDQKQKEYDTLMQNLSSGMLPAEIIEDIGVHMSTIKAEIESLKQTEPPKDFTVDHIHAWLNSLKNTPDEKAIHLLIERIDIKNKTDINITSTLTSVLGNHGCGGAQHSLPEILFHYTVHRNSVPI